jgi:3-deoxy-D-manno-octulosonic-acid transferase
LKLLLYDFFILCFEFGAWLLSPFNTKARLWLLGRVNWQTKLHHKIDKAGFRKNGKPVVWMHASSLGEYEQGKPVLDAIKTNYPGVQIIITFFSPSGYEVVKQLKGPEIVCYLPTDTPANAIRFIQMTNPSLVLWVKYEYWYHHLKTLYKRKVPVLLISGMFFEGQAFFKWYGNFHKQMLFYFDHFFVLNENGANLLQPLLTAPNNSPAANKITISGDTRFDRVIDIADNWMPIPPLEKWLFGADKPDSYKLLAAGSTWPEDEEELVHFVRTNKDVRLILAPHQVEPDLLKDTLALFNGAILFSDLLNDVPPDTDSNVLIINNVGMLSRIYRYATVCYIGGGFSGSGIHNVLEAAVYGKPVVHGPEYEKYSEAVGLLEAGGSFAVDNALELEKQLRLLFTDESLYNTAAETAKNFVYAQKGSTQKIMNYIQANRLLTNL